MQPDSGDHNPGGANLLRITRLHRYFAITTGLTCLYGNSVDATVNGWLLCRLVA